MPAPEYRRLSQLPVARARGHRIGFDATFVAINVQPHSDHGLGACREGALGTCRFYKPSRNSWRSHRSGRQTMYITIKQIVEALGGSLRHPVLCEPVTERANPKSALTHELANTASPHDALFGGVRSPSRPLWSSFRCSMRLLLRLQTIIIEAINPILCL